MLNSNQMLYYVYSDHDLQPEGRGNNFGKTPAFNVNSRSEIRYLRPLGSFSFIKRA